MKKPNLFGHAQSPIEADLIQADVDYNNLKNSGELQRRRDAENFNRQMQQNLRDYRATRTTPA